MNKQTMIFVFGSNLSGIHGAGAARMAYEKYSAVHGQGLGPTGRAYAIPTKDRQIRETLPLRHIRPHVNSFIAYAKDMEHMQFMVTRIGCGLAGLQDKDIAPMFLEAPDNCYFDTAWESLLLGAMPSKKFWGTF